MKRLKTFSILGSYSIGFDLEYETTVSDFIERLKAGGVKLEKVKLRENNEKNMRTVHGSEYSVDLFLQQFDSIVMQAKDVVYNICGMYNELPISMFMKNNTSKVSVLTTDYYFELEKILGKDAAL